MAYSWRSMVYSIGKEHGQNRGPTIPKIDMRKFDGKDPITWILHME